MKEKKIKIAHVSPVYPPYRGGIGTVAKEYVDGLRAMEWDAQVFVPDYKNDESTDIEHRIKPLFAFGNGAILPSLVSRLKDFDIIHLHYPFYGSAILTIFAAWLWHIPVVMTYHMQTKASGIKGLIFKIHRWIVEPIFLRAAKSILISSIDYAKSIGVKECIVTDMPFGVDDKRFFPIINKDLKEKTVFLFVGGLDDAHYFKGVDVLLAASSNLYGDWELQIVGSGNLIAHYKKLAEELGIKDRVVFLGKISNEDLPGVYQAADVHILPSIDRSEAFGLVTLEAGASGLPSIVSDLPGVRTLVDDEVSGFIVCPGSQESLRQAMEKCIKDPGLCEQMGLQARSRIQKYYTKTHCLQRLIEVYNVILKKEV
ncbi:glycosyltransferase family 4 protein [Patescibacteria group bacterium]|nr:glycosyltransferase family 4 protein [Patescibacteria group bacterium]